MSWKTVLMASVAAGAFAAAPALAGPVGGASPAIVTVQISDVNGTPASAVNGDDGFFDEFEVPVDDDGNFEFLQEIPDGNVSGGGNVDPNQTFGVSFTDVGAPTSVAVTLVTPFVTGYTGLISMFGTGGLTVSDSAGDGGTVSPLGIVGGFVAFDIDGVILMVTGLAPVVYPGSATTVVAFPSVSLVFDCSTLGDGSCDSMSSFIGFTGSGGGDTYTFSSGLTISAVAEPASMAMLGLGLLGLGGLARRRLRG